MNPTHPHPIFHERFVDAREAAHCLNLPMYWLTHARERQRLSLPHYRVGKLLRFKLSELEDWIADRQLSSRSGGADAGL